MELETIKSNCIRHFAYIIEEYKLKIKLDDFLQLQSCFILFSYDNTFRCETTTLLNEYIKSKDGEKQSKKRKQNKATPYNFSKRKMEKLSSDQILQVKSDFLSLELYFKQYKRVLEIEELNKEIFNVTTIVQEPIKGIYKKPLSL